MVDLAENLINDVVLRMRNVLGSEQISVLHQVMSECIENYNIQSEKNELQTSHMDNTYYIEMFLSVKSLGGLSEKSIDNYRYALRKFVDETGYDVVRVTTNHIRTYLSSLQRRNQSSTVNNNRKVLSTFYAFMTYEGYIVRNPMLAIPHIKEEQKAKVFHTDYDMECLRDACITLREKALIDFILSTGLRIEEIPRIKLTDINWDKRTVIIHGKGNKQRVIPFSVRAKKHVREYVETRKQDSIYLFCREKAPYDKEPTESMIAFLFNGIRARAGLNNITIHGIRRWIACRMDDCGASPTLIQDMLGHASFDTTKKHYLSSNIDNLISIHKRIFV